MPTVTSMGKKRVSFSLATSRRYRDNNGEQKEQTDWHNIVVWGKTADLVEQLRVSKGTTLYVEGRLTNRSWTDQATGQKRNTTEVELDTFQLLTPRNAQTAASQHGNPYSQQNGGHNPYSQQNAASGQQPQHDDMGYGGYNPEEDDGLPF
ncbi:MAG: single-stranded DNA-binding protein [Fibrobacter sp.]|nr:single-stranded DNA-binding protein [Fibrobacter sp.]